MFYKCVQKLTQTIHITFRQIKEINYEGEENTIRILSVHTEIKTNHAPKILSK